VKLLASLTNRVFLACALLAVVSIGIAVAIVNVRVTREAERELSTGLAEAARLLDQYHELQIDSSFRTARLIADLPKLKAAVDLADPPTVAPLARDYRSQLGSSLLSISHRSGQVLATDAGPGASIELPASAVGEALAGREATAFRPIAGGILEVVSVPILIGRNPPEILGALSVGFSFDERLAARFKALTESEIAFALDGQIRAATLPAGPLGPLLGLPAAAATSRLWLGDQEYVALARPIRPLAQAPAVGGRPTALILRSRSERLSFVKSLHTALAATALTAVALATLLSYAVARTVTRPLRAITATMSEMAATGDLTRRVDMPPPEPWQDEDARLLASTFTLMTGALARSQREAGQRERLAALGRLSTVIAHEIRNPLMIIKAAVRTLRQDPASEGERREALVDIDGEVGRLNRLVDGVLDFARPIRYTCAAQDLNELCRSAASAAAAADLRRSVELDLAPGLPTLVTDAERLHGVLVNLLTNARQAVELRLGDAGGEAPGPPIKLGTRPAGPERVAVVVRDGGVGIAPEDLARVWEPYFTTKRGGTGLGLAIARNIVEGLGGSIAIDSRPMVGTQVTIELPLAPPPSALGNGGDA